MAERLIHILPEQVASQIAAGEVVERPASALKELVENSLDAGASAISVEIERGGAGLIAVGDDGCGMGREDAILSLRRHATSKIRDAADLAAIRTMGFRGEALASIASVARMRMVTRRAADLAGVEIVADGGEISLTRECAAAPGTRIEVRELFFNTPARLKFLKTVATEQGAAAEVIARLAIAHWRVAFKLVADGRVVYDLSRAASALERMRQLYGAKVASRMLPLRFPARRRARLRPRHDQPGLLSDAADGVHFRQPARGARPRAPARGHAGLRHADPARALSRGRRVRRDAPRGRRRQRSSDEDRGALSQLGRGVRGGLPCVARNGSPIRRRIRRSATRRAADASQLPKQLRADRCFGQHLRTPRRRSAWCPTRRRSRAPSNARWVWARRVLNGRSSTAASTPPRSATARAGNRGSGAAMNGGRRASRPARPSRREADSERQIPMYSRLRVVGQLFAGYIALEGDDGLILVDQHAAHERVTFEKLRAELRAGGIRVQAMLTPVPIELNPARAPQVHQALGEFRAMGFELEPFGPATLLLKGAPAVFGAEGGARLLAEMIDAMGEDGFRQAAPRRSRNCSSSSPATARCAWAACSDEPEISALLEELDRTEFKTNCPHGRPVHIQWGRGLIERMFRR